MNFTGERFVPHVHGQIRYEHLHRYALARSFATGKIVLDLASGEGYGSRLMADSARYIIGIDIDPASVAHATNAYSAPARVAFATGSCARLPLADATLDLVVSFETIEHLAEQEAMLAEIKRTLRPAGALIISSPNRVEYSQAARYVNPYHVKELDLAEFTALLRQHFAHVKLFGQRIGTASFVYSLEASASEVMTAFTSARDDVVSRVPSLEAPTYFIALCSDDPEAIRAPIDSVFLDPSDDIRRQYDDLVYQQVRDIHTTLDQTRAELGASRSQLDARDADLRQRAEVVADLALQNNELRRRVDALMIDAEATSATLGDLTTRLQISEDSRGAASTEATQLRGELGAIKEQVVELTEALDESERQLAAINATRAWKLAQAWYRFRLSLAPSRVSPGTPVNDPAKLAARAPVASPSPDSSLPGTVVFLSHDAFRAGAQIFLLNYLKWLKANADVPFEVILGQDGELRPDFEAICRVTLWSDTAVAVPRSQANRALPESVTALVRDGFETVFANTPERRRQTVERLKAANVRLIYSNTLANGELLRDLAALQCPAISHAHELTYWITHRSSATNNRLVREHTHRFVAASEATRQGLRNAYGLPSSAIEVIHEFIPLPQPEADATLGSRLRRELGITESALIIGASGTTDWRKGPDLFVLLAREVLRAHPEREVHFVWVGGAGTGPIHGALEHDIDRLGLRHRVHFIGAKSNPIDYYRLFDVFALVSREDPFPLVMLEAAALELPIVCFEGSGGAPEFVSTDCGFVLPYLDVAGMAARVNDLLDSVDLRSQLGRTAAKKVNDTYDTSNMAPKILSLIKRYLQPGSSSQLDPITGLPVPTRAEVLRRVAVAQPTATPRELFSDVDDQTWFWLHNQGVKEDPKLAALLPSLPEDDIQLRFTGSAGEATLREAFAAYQLFRWISNRWLDRPLQTVLDFGCGWGRTIRYFLRDVEPANLFGADCYPGMIEICKATNQWSQFELVDPLPPSQLPDGRFDLIYCYSVFSHLSEAAHLSWLSEFERILRPGGLLVATTWPREFIVQCAEIRAKDKTDFWKKGPARAFLDSQSALALYDGGGFTHDAVGGGDVLDASFFGETCIPEAYVRDHWSRSFEVLAFLTDRKLCPQNVIVVRKPAQAN